MANALSSFAQEKEFGVWAGTVVYLGDLNPNVSFKNARQAFGTFFRYNLNNRMALRAGVNYGFLQASDAKAVRYPYLQHRNLSFKSQLFEGMVAYEINFFPYSNVPNSKERNWTPYVFGGASIFYYSPSVRYDGTNFKLEPIGTEGQKDPNVIKKERGYETYSFAIAYGGGFKYAFTQNWALNVEISSRATFTDFMDDVSGKYPAADELYYLYGDVNIAELLSDRSTEVGPKIGYEGKQRGTSKDKDRFMFLGVTLTYTIHDIKCPKVF